MDETEEFSKYYNLTLRYLSYRSRSEKEIKDYLVKKKLDEGTIESIIIKLKEYKFLDDTKFAKTWISSRLRYKNKPVWIIEKELSDKGIKKELIQELVSDLDSKKETDLKSAKELAQKKLDFYRNLSPQKRREKTASYLLRKGFSWDVVKKVLQSN